MAGQRNRFGGQFSRRGFLFGATASGLVVSAGCDLLEFAQNPVINFKLPPRTYTLKTDDPAWKSAPTTFNVTLSCTDAKTCCPSQLSECASVPAVCQSGVCGIEFPLEVANTIDLAKEAPELAGNMQVVSEITLKSLEYTIVNTVGVEMPPVKLYIAPKTTTTASGAGAQFIGETPKAPKGTTMQTQETPADAQKAFAMYAKDVKTPFNIIAKTTMSILSGTPISQGQIDIKVTGTVSARLAI
jgi:hypothetical protein